MAGSHRKNWDVRPRGLEREDNLIGEREEVTFGIKNVEYSDVKVPRGEKQRDVEQKGQNEPKAGKLSILTSRSDFPDRSRSAEAGKTLGCGEKHRRSREKRKASKEKMRRRKVFMEVLGQVICDNVFSKIVNQALKKLKNDHMKDTPQSERYREFRWLGRQWPEVVEYYIFVVEEINRKFKNRIVKGREMMKIVTDQANKVEISEMVNQSMSVKGFRGHTSGGGVQGRRRKGNRGRWKKERRTGKKRKEVQRLWRQESRHSYYHRCNQMYNKGEESIEGEN